jgi:hypothetical protein
MQYFNTGWFSCNEMMLTLEYIKGLVTALPVYSFVVYKFLET